MGPRLERALRSVAACAAFTAVFVGLALGWTILAGRPQGPTWKHQLQSGAHADRDVERLVRAERRQFQAKNQ